jgi:hypothetical protein
MMTKPDPSVRLAQQLIDAQHDPRDFASYTLEQTLDRAIGATMARSIPDLLRLAELLYERHQGEDCGFDFGHADRFAFGLRNEDEIKAFALCTQNIDYAVILKQKYGRWELHLREWFPDVREDIAAGRSLPMNIEAGVKGQLSLTQAIKAAPELARYSDTGLGPGYASRASLQSLADNNFDFSTSGPCNALRYGDLRDAGFLASVKMDYEGAYHAEKCLSVALHRLRYVWYDLLSAIDTLVPGPSHDEVSAADQATAKQRIKP